jgi:PAS domain S-box-containing protein
MLNSTLKNARILIVDDQESNIALLESVLAREGYTDLKSITDSRKVSALFESFQPDLILLDLRMPHLDGFAVMEQLRERIVAEEYLPILVLTADITPETKLRALAVGARDFLTKPVEVAEVSLRIRNLLETRYLHLQQKQQNNILEEKIQERTAELQQRLEDLALINALNTAINRGDDLQTIIALMADELHRIFHCIGTMTAFPNTDKQSLRIQHMEFQSRLASQVEMLAGASIGSLPLKIPMTGDGQFAQILRAGQPKAFNDADTIKIIMAEYTENQFLKSLAAPIQKLLNIRSLLLIPLISESEIYGLLEMARTEPTTASDLDRVQSIAGQLTSAIGRRRAQEETTLRNKQLTVLNDLGQALNKLSSIPEILERTSNLIGKVFDNQNLYIAFYDEATNYVSFPIYWMEGERRNFAEGRPLGNGMTEFVIRKRAPVLISNHVREAMAEHGVALVGSLCKCYLGVPLLVDERLIGVIAVQDYENANVFNTNHVELLSTIASQTAIAIENAKLYETSQKELNERKRAEELLRNSEARYRAVVETANDAIITIDSRGAIVDWNKASEIIFGFSYNEVLGSPITSIMPKSFHGQHDHGLERVVISEERKIIGKTVEVPGRKKDGQEFPLEMSVAEWTTQAGTFFTAVIRDISERKQADERILQSEKKFRELFQVNKDGIAIFLVNPHGPPSTFIELNDAAPKMLGYTREEMLKLSPTMLEPFTPPDQQRARASEFDAQGIVSFETKLLHKDGHPVFAEFSAQLIQYEGRPAIMNIVRDISERKQRQNELQAITNLSAALRSAETRAEMLPVIVEQLSSMLHCDAISAEMIDPLTHETVVDAAYGPWTALIGYRQGEGTGLYSIVSETQKPYLNNKLADDARIGSPSYLLDGITAGAGVPLIAREQLIGFLWIGRKNEIAESEVRLLAAMADMAANAIYRATLHEQSQKDAADLAQAYDTTLEGWAHALELRDQETEGHTRRVMQMTVDLARKMGIGEHELENVRRGALLHDIGKMGIPDKILLKPGPLDEGEWEVMRLHPEYAHQLLETIEYLRPILNIPYCHHEKWDGSGYPLGLKGEQIPFEARIFAIVDVWDALRSDRPYRKAWTVEKVRAYLIELSGSHFDPKVVQSFFEYIG